MFSFILGILVGQEVQNIPRVKPILENGFVKTVEYFKKYDTHNKQDEKTYYSYFYSYFQKSGDDNSKKE